MQLKSNFDRQALDNLERKLWDIIENRSFLDNRPLPHLDALLEEEICENYASSIEAYAQDLVQNRHRDVVWQNHPFLNHLTQCPVCQRRLGQQIAITTQGHLQLNDLDITLIYDQLASEIEERTRGETHSPREPQLLYASFHDFHPDWFYSLEYTQLDHDGPWGLLLTLSHEQEQIKHIPIRIVLRGRILHGTTDEKGQIFFPGVAIPSGEYINTPAIHIHIQYPPVDRTHAETDIARFA